jgi:hypothetical protein
MSESTDTTVIEPVDEPAARRPAVVALAAAGAVFLGVLVWLLLVAPLLGADGEDPLGPVGTAQSSDAVAEVASADEVLDDTPIAVTYEVLLERDPFEPVVPRPASETSAGEGTVEGAPAGVEVVASDGDPVLVVDGTPVVDDDEGFVGGDGGDGGTTGGGATPVVTEPAGCSITDTGAICDGRSVGLIRISEVDGRRTAVIQVGSTMYEVEKGETFAGNLRLRTVGEDRVTILYGEEEFTLQVGERVLK